MPTGIRVFCQVHCIIYLCFWGRVLAGFLLHKPTGICIFCQVRRLFILCTCGPAAQAHRHPYPLPSASYSFDILRFCHAVHWISLVFVRVGALLHLQASTSAACVLQTGAAHPPDTHSAPPHPACPPASFPAFPAPCTRSAASFATQPIPPGLTSTQPARSPTRLPPCLPSRRTGGAEPAAQPRARDGPAARQAVRGGAGEAAERGGAAAAEPGGLPFPGRPAVPAVCVCV